MMVIGGKKFYLGSSRIFLELPTTKAKMSIDSIRRLLHLAEPSDCEKTTEDQSISEI